MVKNYLSKTIDTETTLSLHAMICRGDKPEFSEDTIQEDAQGIHRITLPAIGKTYEIDPIANEVPPANSDDLNKLTVDITENGQIEPILMYKGKVIDGRTRLLCMLLLGLEPKVEVLDYMDRKEVEKKIRASNTRRDLSSVQKAIMAVKAYYQTPNQKVNYRDLCAKYGTNSSMFHGAKEIHKQRPDILDTLWRGEKILLSDGKVSSSLIAIAKDLKKTPATVVKQDPYIQELSKHKSADFVEKAIPVFSALKREEVKSRLLELFLE